MQCTQISCSTRDNQLNWICIAYLCKSNERSTGMQKPLGTRATTGEVCPESGNWRVGGTPSTSAPIGKGNRMPPYGGKSVVWILYAYA